VRPPDPALAASSGTAGDFAECLLEEGRGRRAQRVHLDNMLVV
jgi:hypothetical protein